MPFSIRLSCLCIFSIFILTAPARADDRHAGYYYPTPQTSELFSSYFEPLAGTSKRSRIGFTVGLNAEQKKRSYAPPYHIFAKGSHAQKMIIVATGPGQYNTIYRLRALLASLSADARISPLFRELENPEDATFLDLARMVGFEIVTITDGDTIAHQIDIQ